MKKYLFLLLFICFSTIAYNQQSIEIFVKQNQIRVSTIDPDSTIYDELEIIGKAIGNSRIVMLGEQDHGDAPAFAAKTRLIKYLHEKKGFNVLAFESDFFALNDGWDNLPKTKKLIDTFIRKNITPLWSACNSCQHLFYNYLPGSYATSSPLMITGFDSEIFFSWSSKYLYYKLDSVLKKIKAPITALPGYSSEIFKLITNWYSYSNDTANLNKINSYLLLIQKQLTDSLGLNNFWSILCENLQGNNLKFHYTLTDKIKASQIRDSLMAMNLKWLTEIKFANKKIIVWAANMHIHKFSGHFSLDFLNTINSMGSIYLRDSLVNKVTYVMGFTSLQGTAGRIGAKKYKINRPKKNAFENWINPSFNYAFVNFKNYTDTQEERFYMSGFGHNNYEGIWNKVYDGVFYIKQMFPCSQ